MDQYYTTVVVPTMNTTTTFNHCKCTGYVLYTVEDKNSNSGHHSDYVCWYHFCTGSTKLLLERNSMHSVPWTTIHTAIKPIMQSSTNYCFEIITLRVQNRVNHTQRQNTQKHPS